MSAPPRRTVSSGSRWEPLAGYARAVRVGSAVFVSGTVGDGADAYAQAVAALATIERALVEAGAALGDVVRTRIFVTDIRRDWEAVARAHREVFATIRPATSMLEIAGLIDPKYVVEIEADAVVS
ncbi:MAG TPA: Rid family hydrolase [Candidatus Tumulicola sp.]|jgi:enamine deaminase RidA (YjgF/YER057c/UK114 family)